jgi:hypothetical protein
MLYWEANKNRAIERILAFSDVIGNIAYDFDIPTVDFFDQNPTDALVSDIDGFHPSSRGHASIAWQLLQLILPQFEFGHVHWLLRLFARPQAGRNQRRFFFLLGDGGGVRTLLQKRVICFALFFIMVAAWRRPSIVARLRAEPAAALAPLNHMLKKGFFLIHGFFICDFSYLTVSCPKA